MRITDELKSSLSRSISSMICAWIVTSSAVVGSSAIRIVRVVRERHRDHRALAHAARELVRIVVDALLGMRDADLPQELHRAVARRLLRRRPRA